MTARLLGKATPTGPVCPLPLLAPMDTGGPGVPTAPKRAVVPLAALTADTLLLPVTVPRVRVSLASPLALVVVDADARVPPPVITDQLTVALGTGVPLESVTRATKGEERVVPTCCV